MNLFFAAFVLGTIFGGTAALHYANSRLERMEQQRQRQIEYTDELVKAVGHAAATLALPPDNLPIERKAALELTMLSALVQGQRHSLELGRIAFDLAAVQAQAERVAEHREDSEAIAVLLDLIRPGLGKLVSQK
ncbi:MAG: hypothetical protein ACREVZ_01280 [Burkholderiales bacterium]